MLELTWVEFFLFVIPEVFIIIWSICIISRQAISKYKYLLCSISSALVTFIARLLPIHSGIHTIIAGVFVIFVLFTAGIPLVKSIFGIMITIVLIIMGESINMILLNILKINVNDEFKNPFIKCILQFPSLVILVLLILLIRFLLDKKEGVKIK